MWYLQFSSTCNSAIQLALAQGIWKYSIFTTIKVLVFGFPSTMQCGWSTVEKGAMSQDSVFQIWWVPESYSKDRLQCPSSRDVNCVGVLGQETWFEKNLFKLFFYWLPTSTSSTCSEHVGVAIRRLPENQYCVIRNGKSVCVWKMFLLRYSYSKHLYRSTYPCCVHFYFKHQFSRRKEYWVFTWASYTVLQNYVHKNLLFNVLFF